MIPASQGCTSKRSSEQCLQWLRRGFGKNTHNETLEGTASSYPGLCHGDAPPWTERAARADSAHKPSLRSAHSLKGSWAAFRGIQLFHLSTKLKVPHISSFHEIGCIWDCEVHAETREEMSPGSESGISPDALVGCGIFINEAVCSLYDSEHFWPLEY